MRLFVLATALLFFGSCSTDVVQADSYNELFSDYDCNSPLMDRAVLTATSSLNDRGPEMARLNGLKNKMNQYSCRRWVVDLSTFSLSPSQLAQAVSAVQPEERTRLMKYVFMEDFLSSLVGRLLMRKFVSDSTGIAYHDIQFERDTRGKPYLNVEKSKAYNRQEIQPLSFNVSHQGDFVVLAGVVAKLTNKLGVDTADFGVGVDVMKIEYFGGKPLTEFFRLMKNKFAENEWQYITRSQHNEDDKLKAFMRHWCLKESYVKELGCGITVNLRKISFSVGPEDLLETNTMPLTTTTLRCNGDAMSNWYFEEHLLHREYCTALAFRNCRPDVGNFEFLSIADLLVMQSKTEDVHIMNYCRDVFKKLTKKK